MTDEADAPRDGDEPATDLGSEDASEDEDAVGADEPRDDALDYGDDDAYDDDEPDGEDDGSAAEPYRRSRLRRTFSAYRDDQLQDPDVRTRIRTLDPQERRWGFIAAAVVLLGALTFVPSLLHNTPEWLTEPLVKGHCLYTLVHKVCERHVVYTPGDYVWPGNATQSGIVLLSVLGGTLLGAVWFSKRTLTVFTSLITGFFIGILGVILFLYGGWLLVRSFRLSRYGTTDAKEARAAASERAKEKREARKESKQTRDAPAPGPRSTVAASKRYTPAKTKSRRK